MFYFTILSSLNLYYCPHLGRYDARLTLKIWDSNKVRGSLDSCYDIWPS